ncbi:MAG: hypothetical protein J2P54_10330, partial [Bradyrhizobiaceae bacterium]|nr:hypothetical protein [Bradyrhizobiaceae bacterium]
AEQKREYVFWTLCDMHFSTRPAPPSQAARPERNAVDRLEKRTMKWDRNACGTGVSYASVIA